jgi:hypothetical protein
MSRGERDVWTALDVLREAYDHDYEGAATPPS